MTPILLCKIMTSILLFNLKVSVIPNGFKKYMSFAINDKLSFIDSFQYLGSTLDSSIINLGKNDFNCLSQEFDSSVLDLVK